MSSRLETISCYYFYASRIAAFRLGRSSYSYPLPFDLQSSNFISFIYHYQCKAYRIKCIEAKGLPIIYIVTNMISIDGINSLTPFCILKYLFHTNSMYTKATTFIPRIFQNSKSFSLLRPARYNFGSSIGQNFDNFIQVSTARHLREMTEKFPQNIFINSYDQHQQLTYQQVLQKAEQLATGLVKNFSLKPKDRIGLYAYNKSQWVIIQLAAAMADLILVNINPNYQSQQLAYTLEKVGVKVLFMNDKFKSLDYINIVKKIVPDIQNQNPYNIKNTKLSELKSVVRINDNSDYKKGFVNYTDISQPAQSSFLKYDIDTNDPANIQFTSGTTGRPKAATLSHYNILNNAYIIGNKCRYTHVDNIAVPVPFYHCFGMIMGTLAAMVRGGGITVITEGFDPKKTLLAVDKYKCTSLYGVPTMFIEYLRHYEQNPSHYDVSNLRTGIVAGAVCSQALMTKIINVLNLKDMTNCYGMTQTSPVSFQTCPTDPFHRKTTTVGRILPGLQAKIVNAQGQVCKPGEPGQFWVKGWSVMLNYWGDERATKGSIEDGWMKSGDLGVIDKDGYLSIVGRIKDMIIRGGQNIYPKEIEEYLVKMNGILDAQVVAVSDEKYGEEVAAVIKVKDATTNEITSVEVYNFCKGKIANYKIPSYVKFVNEYPMTVSGKVQKYILRKELEQQKAKKEIEKYRVNTKVIQ